MDAQQLQAIHDRIRKAQLPGYCLHYADGPDMFWLEIHDINEVSYTSREHSWHILMEWADETLSSLGA